MRLAWGLVVAGLLCAPVLAQEAAPAPAAAAPRVAGWPLVLGKPYSNVREYDRDQKKADGSTYRLHESTKYWRDSAGRVRSEVTREGRKEVFTYLTDPAAKVQYRWNNLQKVAFMSKLGDPLPERPAPRPLGPGEVRNVSTTIEGQRMKGRMTALPAKTFEGLETVGSHVVSYSDPERQNVLATTDSWYQPDYQLAFFTEINDAQYGHRVFHLRNFKPEEPKADLFQVPKGFTIKTSETPDTEQFE